MRFVVLRLAAQAVVTAGVCEIVGSDFRQVVINVLAVLEAERAASGEDGGQVRVAVAVAVAHAAAEEHHRAVEQRVLAIAHGGELVEKVRGLRDCR